MKHLWLFAVVSLIHIVLGGANIRGLQEVHLARVLKDSGMPNVFPNAKAESEALFLFTLNPHGQIVTSRLPVIPFRRPSGGTGYRYSRNLLTLNSITEINSALDSLSTNFPGEFRQFLIGRSEYIYGVNLGGRSPNLIGGRNGRSLDYSSSLKAMDRYIRTLPNDHARLPTVKNIVENLLTLRSTELQRYIKVANKLLDIRETLYSKDIRFGSDGYDDAVKAELQALKDADRDIYYSLRDANDFDINPERAMADIEAVITDQEGVIKRHLFPRNLFYNLKAFLSNAGPPALGDHQFSPEDIEYRGHLESLC